MGPTQHDIVCFVDERLAKLIPKFMAAQKEQLRQMKTALTNGQFETLKFLGHQMKGSGGGFGFTALGTFGSEIERAAHDGDSHDLGKCISQIDDYLAQVKIEFQKTE